MTERVRKIIVSVSVFALGGLLVTLVILRAISAVRESNKAEAQDMHDSAASYVTIPPEPMYQPTEAVAKKAEPSATPAPTGSPTDFPTVSPEPEITEEPNSDGTERGAWLRSASQYNLDALYQLNPDLCGWIRIDGTEIDYPIANIGDGPDKYNELAYDGKTKSAFGTIFTRNKVENGLPKNLVLYGHNMEATGYGMFTQLMKYQDASFASSHQDVLIILGNEPYHYKLVCGFHIKVTDEFHYETMSFAGEKSFLAHVEKEISLAKVKGSGSVNEGDQILTLSTCDRHYGGKNGRWVLVFVRVR